jgi:ELWxxDGT repeat protein
MLKKAFALSYIFLLIVISTAHSQTFVKKFSSITSFAKLGNNLFFGADDGVHGVELWKTDGTVNGTLMVKDIFPGYASSNATSLFAFNNKIYFSANDGINGAEVWQTDGTAGGTIMLKDLNPAHVGNTGSQPGQFVVFKEALYFTAAPDSYYSTLWKTDGTAAGTIQITANDYSGVSQLTVVGDVLFFTKNATSLWKTDGTVAGTQQVKVDDYYTVESLHNVNNELVFITSYTYTHDKIRLYKLNPGSATPLLLHSYNAVLYGSNDIGNITAVGQRFYFSIRTVDANDNGTDALWMSDGTVAGTSAVKAF